jgi:hypothetical protein
MIGFVSLPAVDLAWPLLFVVLPQCVVIATLNFLQGNFSCVMTRLVVNFVQPLARHQLLLQKYVFSGREPWKVQTSNVCCLLAVCSFEDGLLDKRN